jgi:hypothetical protein
MIQRIFVLRMQGQIHVAPDTRSQMLIDTGVYREVDADAAQRVFELQENLEHAVKAMYATASSPIADIAIIGDTVNEKDAR